MSRKLKPLHMHADADASWDADASHDDESFNGNKVAGRLKTLLLALPDAPSETFAAALNLPCPLLHRIHQQFLSSYHMNNGMAVTYNDKRLTDFTAKQVDALLKLNKVEGKCFSPFKICQLLDLEEKHFAFHWIFHLGQTLNVAPSSLTKQERNAKYVYAQRQYADNFFYNSEKHVHDFYGRIIPEYVVKQVCF